MSLFETTYKLKHDYFTNAPIIHLAHLDIEIKEDAKCIVEINDGNKGILRTSTNSNVVLMDGLSTSNYHKSNITTYYYDLSERSSNKELIKRRNRIHKFLNNILDNDKEIGLLFYKELAKQIAPDKTLYEAMRQPSIEYTTIMSYVYDKNKEMHSMLQEMVNLYPEFKPILIASIRQSN